MDHTANNKRVAKNTVILYLRMLFILILNLYTSRVVLQVLGIDDFGIYNVVGGLVMMFSLLSGSISAAISRFLTFELGRNDSERLAKVFSTSITILIGLGTIIIVLGEIIGVWLLNTQLNIPDGRMLAANWVLQFTLFTFLANLISLPYNAAIIAHEKATAFAAISVTEVVVKLGIIFMVMAISFDRLVTYGFLMFLLALMVRVIYAWYCQRNFEECKYHFVYDKTLLKEMNSFAGWNLIGASTGLLANQGVTLLVNVFFGVAANAARGIVNQVDNAVRQMVNNITLATDPQIIKSYAEKDYTYMLKLTFMGSKYSFFLAMFFFVPILLESRAIISLWLGQYPEDAVLFLRLTIFVTLINVLSNTLMSVMMATGNIKTYQIVVGGIGASVFFFTLLAYWLGAPVESTYYIMLATAVAQLVARIVILRGMVKFPALRYIKEVLVNISIVAVISIATPTLVFINMRPSIPRLLIVIIVSVFSSIAAVYAIGMGRGEKTMLQAKVKSIIQNKRL